MKTDIAARDAAIYKAKDDCYLQGDLSFGEAVWNAAVEHRDRQIADDLVKLIGLIEINDPEFLLYEYVIQLRSDADR